MTDHCHRDKVDIVTGARRVLPGRRRIHVAIVGKL